MYSYWYWSFFEKQAKLNAASGIWQLYEVWLKDFILFHTAEFINQGEGMFGIASIANVACYYLIFEFFSKS